MQHRHAHFEVFKELVICDHVDHAFGNVGSSRNPIAKQSTWRLIHQLIFTSIIAIYQISGTYDDPRDVHNVHVQVGGSFFIVTVGRDQMAQQEEKKSIISCAGVICSAWMAGRLRPDS